MAEIISSNGIATSARNELSPNASSRLRPQRAAAEPVVRIAPGRDGVSIWSPELFGDPASPHVREFLARAFSVEEVAAVEIRRAQLYGRIHYASASNAREVWLKLGRALAKAPDSDRGAGRLYLDQPALSSIWVSRVAGAVSTWRLRFLNHSRIRLSHPLLLNRPDIAYRLEEELAAILGVEDFRANTLSSSVAVRFNPAAISAERLVGELEKSWPRLLDGLEGPPSTTRLIVAGGLTGLAFTGQYLVPSLRLWALAGVAAYSFANVKNAARQLSHGEGGLPVLYSTGLMFTLLSGMPFSSAAIAVLMQFWPQATFRTMTVGGRRLFAVHRQRPTWARIIHDDGREVEVDLEVLRPGDVIAVRAGEAIPVDGVVTEGLAAVDEEALSSIVGPVDKAPGDKVYSRTVVRDGRLKVWVVKVGTETAASHIGARLPHSRIGNLPSSAEAERIANRNVKPALAMAGATVLLARRVRPAQAIIRPDYATGPRLSAQFNALYDLADGLGRGILFREPAALDRLAAADFYAFDETAGLEQRRLEVAGIFPARDVSASAVVAFATAGFPASGNEVARALQSKSAELGAAVPAVPQRSRRAGVIRYWDADNRAIEVATSEYVKSTEVKLPSSMAEAAITSGSPSNLLRPLWVLREGELLGAVTFRRSGQLAGEEVIAALNAHGRRGRIAYLSSRPQAAAEIVARRLGIAVVRGDLDHKEKAEVVKEFGGRTLWIGDGTSSNASAAISASAVSVSVAGLSGVQLDGADVVLLRSDLQSLLTLRDIGHDHRDRIAADYRAVYTANLLGAAGGLLGRFGSLEAGLTSHLGISYVYLRHWLRLRSLISRIEARRAPIEGLVASGAPVIASRARAELQRI